MSHNTPAADSARLPMTRIVTKNAIANPSWDTADHYRALEAEGFTRFQVLSYASRQVHAAVAQAKGRA